MENASKALIIAGAVLIGILIISMGVLLATSLQKTAKTYYTSMTTNEIQKFNSEITKNFIIKDGKTYITAQGIITLKNILLTEKYSGIVKLKLFNNEISNQIDFTNKFQSEGNFLSNYGLNEQTYEVDISYSEQGMIKGMINNVTIT